MLPSAPLAPAQADEAAHGGKGATHQKPGEGSARDGFLALFAGADHWLGAMVPKRWAKRAVTRNAIKRQIYTLSADLSPIEARAAYVVRLRRDFSRKEFLSASSDALKAAVRTELTTLLLAVGARAT